MRTFSKGEWIYVFDAYGIAGQVMDIQKARDAITDGTVNQPTGLAGKGDPRDVLRDIFDRAKKTHQSFGYNITLPPPANSPSLVELYTANRGLEFDPNMQGAVAAAGTAEHLRGYIRLGPIFFTNGFVNNMLWGPSGAPKLDDEQSRALTLLHELKHIITGDYSSTHDIPFNTQIYNDGIKNLKIKR